MTVYEFLEKMGFAWDFYINHDGRIINNSNKISISGINEASEDVAEVIDLDCISVDFEEMTIYC